MESAKIFIQFSGLPWGSGSLSPDRPLPHRIDWQGSRFSPRRISVAPNSENPHLKQIRLPLVGAGFGLWILAFSRMGFRILNWLRVDFLPPDSGAGLIGTPTNLPGVAEDKSAVNLALTELLWPRIAFGVDRDRAIEVGDPKIFRKLSSQKKAGGEAVALSFPPVVVVELIANRYQPSLNWRDTLGRSLFCAADEPRLDVLTGARARD